MKIVREWFPTVMAIVLLFAVRSSLADHYHVPTGSMEPTLMPGDRVMVNKMAYGIEIPFTDIRVTDGDPVKPGEVVIFDSPADGKRLIKRVIAVSGDTVAVTNGRVLLNGQLIASNAQLDVENYGDREVQLNLEHGGGPELASVTVPDGKVLVMGDHRGRSHDGRSFGFIDESIIYGRALAVFHRRNEGFDWLKL